MFGWRAPLALPNTNASGPSTARRSRIAAIRPFGLKGMRRFSLSFAGCAWDADLAGIPVHALVLNHQHLATAAAEFQGADDAVM
jgi:hypothetical protein